MNKHIDSRCFSTKRNVCALEANKVNAFVSLFNVCEADVLNIVSSQWTPLNDTVKHERRHCCVIHKPSGEARLANLIHVCCHF